MELPMSQSRETNQVTEQPKRLFPVVPTTKIVASGRFPSPPTPEQLKTIFPKEVPATLRLYLRGKIDQRPARPPQNAPVLLIHVATAQDAPTLWSNFPMYSPHPSTFPATS